MPLDETDIRFINTASAIKKADAAKQQFISESMLPLDDDDISIIRMANAQKTGFIKDQILSERHERQKAGQVMPVIAPQESTAVKQQITPEEPKKNILGTVKDYKNIPAYTLYNLGEMFARIGEAVPKPPMLPESTGYKDLANVFRSKAKEVAPEGGVPKLIGDVSSSMAQSISAGLPAAAAGFAIGGPAGAALGYAAGGLGGFGISEWKGFLQDVEDNARQKGATDEDVAKLRKDFNDEALLSGLAEGGFEAIGDLTGAKLLGFFAKPGATAIKKELIDRLANAAIVIGKQSGVEIPSEMATAAVENELRSRAGIDTPSNLAAAGSSILPTLIQTSLMMGIGGAVKSRMTPEVTPPPDMTQYGQPMSASTVGTVQQAERPPAGTEVPTPVPQTDISQSVAAAQVGKLKQEQKARQPKPAGKPAVPVEQDTQTPDNDLRDYLVKFAPAREVAKLSRPQMLSIIQDYTVSPMEQKIGIQKRIINEVKKTAKQPQIKAKVVEQPKQEIVQPEAIEKPTPTPTETPNDQTNVPLPSEQEEVGTTPQEAAPVKTEAKTGVIGKRKWNGKIVNIVRAEDGTLTLQSSRGGTKIPYSMDAHLEYKARSDASRKAMETRTRGKQMFTPKQLEQYPALSLLHGQGMSIKTGDKIAPLGELKDLWDGIIVGNNQISAKSPMNENETIDRDAVVHDFNQKMHDYHGWSESQYIKDFDELVQHAHSEMKDLFEGKPYTDQFTNREQYTEEEIKEREAEEDLYQLRTDVQEKFDIEIDPFDYDTVEPVRGDSKVASEIGKIFNTPVVFVKSKSKDGLPVNGAYLNDKIFINQDSDQHHVGVFTHEWTHVLKTKHPDLYKILDDAISEDGAYDRYLEEKTGDNPLIIDTEKDEFIGDTVAERMSEPSFWQNLYAKSPELVKNFIKMIDEVLSVFKGNPNYNRSKYYNDFNKIRGVIDGVVSEAGAREKQKVKYQKSVAAHTKKIYDPSVAMFDGTDKRGVSYKAGDGVYVNSVNGEIISDQTYKDMTQTVEQEEMALGDTKTPTALTGQTQTPTVKENLSVANKYGIDMATGKETKAYLKLVKSQNPSAMGKVAMMAGKYYASQIKLTDKNGIPLDIRNKTNRALLDKLVDTMKDARIKSDHPSSSGGYEWHHINNSSSSYMVDLQVLADAGWEFIGSPNKQLKMPVIKKSFTPERTAQTAGEVVPELLRSETGQTDMLSELGGQTSMFQVKKGGKFTPQFWNWFGKSKVVDENGEPLVVFKGMPKKAWSTGEDINIIDSPNGPWAGFFTSEKSVAKKFSDAFASMGESQLVSAYLKIENPYILDANGKRAHTLMFDDNVFGKNPTNPDARAAFNKGYDGVIIRNTEDEGDIYIPKYPEQIKSTGNVGTYDPNNPDIRYQTKRGGTFTISPVMPVSDMQSAPVPEGASNTAYNRIRATAEAQVRQDRPLKFKNILMSIPGVKQTMQFERPGLKMTGQDEKLLVAMVADNAARTDVTVHSYPKLVKVFDAFASAFGKDAVHGKSKVSAEFVGTPEEKASEITGWLIDVVQNPQLYKLNNTQKEAIRLLDEHNNQELDYINNEYGTKINKYADINAGGAYLPNVDVSEDALLIAGNEDIAHRRGRGKVRVYATARDRLVSDPTFKPSSDIIKLIEAGEHFRSTSAANVLFKDILGGLTKLQAIQKTHPQLYSKMMYLRGRLQNLKTKAKSLNDRLQDRVEDIGADFQEAIDEFLDSAYEVADLEKVQNRLDVRITRGQDKGMGFDEIQAEIDDVRAQLKELNKPWQAAFVKPYKLVTSGNLFRYFPAKQAVMIDEMLKTSNSWWLQHFQNVKATVFGGDVSPLVGIQTMLGMLAHPAGTVQTIYGGIKNAIKEGKTLRGFSISELGKDIEKDKDNWTRFFTLRGRAPQGTPEEFAGGYLSKIPGYSKATEGMFIAVTRQEFEMWKRLTNRLVKSGVAKEEAEIAASDVASKVYPLLNTTRLGQSKQRSKQFSAIPTSYSFIRQPTSLMARAMGGFIKASTGQQITPSEKLSMQITAQMATSVLVASAVSAALSEAMDGGDDKDILKAIGLAINPARWNGNFASLHLGKFKMPLGGPYRAIFRMVFPAKVKGVPFPVPFSGILNYARNRINPLVSTQIDLLQNKDYYGHQILKGDAPEKLLRWAEYETESLMPLTLGSIMEAMRTGMSPEDAARNTIGQFVAGNITEINKVTPLRNKWEKSLSAYDKLPVESRDKYRKLHPTVEAQLFITGKVTTVSTFAAEGEVKRIIKENEIDPTTIKGVKQSLEKDKDKKTTRTDRMVKALTSGGKK